MHTGSLFQIASVLAWQASVALAVPQPLPMVDLGYELRQAIGYNSTGQYYNFTNIRYAAPPTGERRFKAPQLPVKDRSKVQTGLIGATCPQAQQDYLRILPQWLSPYLTTGSYNVSALNQSGPVVFPPAAGPIDEDCLFLDVMVPQKLFPKGQYGRRGGAPVVVWIYGGSYTFGSKTHWGNPAGLLEESRRLSGDIVYVAINYRLGAFGWLTGSGIQSNIGLHDQRMALDWVQKYIHLFGGDPKQVTVMGHSAGGGSTLLQLTAFGGANGPAPFKRVITQSPATPMIERSVQEKLLRQFLAAANVTNIAEARKLPTETLIRANQLVVGPGTFGSTVFGPVVDGSFVPDLPGRLLARGSYDKRIEILAGFNADEGLILSNPYATNETAYIRYLSDYFPSIRESDRKYITNTLYPPVYDGSQGYRSQIQRNAKQIGDLLINCNPYSLQTALASQSRGYLFSVPPAIHGQEVPYTFYNGPSPDVPFPKVATALQDSIIQFVVNGTSGLTGWPEYGKEHIVMNLNVTSPAPIRSPVNERRCLWWKDHLSA